MIKVTIVRAIIVLLIVIAAVAITEVITMKPVAFVNTEQQYAQDTCVPQGAYVKDLITQRVDHIIAPECAERF